MKQARRATCAGLLLLGMSVTAARAQTPFDFTQCATGPARILVSNEQVRIFDVELRGILTSNHQNKLFDDFIYQFVGVSRVLAGELDARGYAKWTDPDGDYVLSEATAVGPATKPVWSSRFIYGTGKWKGIQGSAQVVPITKRAPLVDGTWQSCNRVTGTFVLPKQSGGRPAEDPKERLH
jgi:hypothetical protein